LNGFLTFTGGVNYATDLRIDEARAFLNDLLIEFPFSDPAGGRSRRRRDLLHHGRQKGPSIAPAGALIRITAIPNGLSKEIPEDRTPHPLIVPIRFTLIRQTTGTS
jgi:hypothetical protein